MKLVHAGVDLVDVRRVRRFLKDHTRARVVRLLSAPERKRYSVKPITPRILARIFAAKEAYFKTLGESWMGLEGFAAMQVSFSSADRFEVQAVTGALAEKFPGTANGCFFQVKHLLGAQVLRLSSSSMRR